MKKFLLLIFFIGFTSYSQIVNIPDNNFRSKLIQLGVDTNNDSYIQFSEALAVTSLPIYNLNISNLTGIEAFQNLISLNCGQNNLSVLNVNGLTNLESLICSYNQLTSLDVSNLVNLKILYIQSNNLTSINLSTLIHLEGLLCTYNQLTTVDVSNSPLLEHLACGNNLLTYLDVSNNPLICTLSCSSMPTLTRLNLKDGSSLCLNNKILNQNPNLRFVCVDNEAEAFYFQNYFQNNNMTNVNINTYCSFVPGGDFNMISGNLTFDADNNGCSSNDTQLNNVKVSISDGLNQGVTHTNLSGNYDFFTSSGNFTVTPVLENPSWFTISPSNVTIPFANSNNNTTIQNFCLTSNGIYKDIEVVIALITPARPGFYAKYSVIYKNKGNQTLSGNVNFNYNDSVLDFVSSTIIPDSQATGNLSWNYSNLLPFESRSINVVLNVNSPTETPAVNIGDTLSFSSNINPVSGDENQLDNSFTMNQFVVGSYDPNDKTCLEGTSISPTKIGDYLHYNINFENTGTAAATFIVVKDIIDNSKFDINSLQVMNSSHSMYTRITGNKVEFIFENINLGANQYGNVVFKIKTKNTLVIGNTVTNNANIYFDYNFPITTNTASTTFQALSNTVHALDNSISVFPNPTSSFLTITSEFIIKSIELFDVQGRVLQYKSHNDSSMILDVSDKSNGIYFVKITSDKGSKLQKIIKE